MHVDKMGKQVAEIALLWHDLRGNLTYKVASKEEQEQMRKRVADVISIYNKAVDERVEYIPYIKSELNSILYTLKRWEEYNNIVLCTALLKISKRLGKK